MATTDDAFEPDEGLPTIRSHRRLLEVISLLCIAYYWFHIQVRIESVVAGFPVHVGSTRYLPLALWLALLWSVWRYGQQLYRTWQVARGQLEGDYNRELDRLGRRLVQRYISGMAAAKRQKLADAYADGTMTFPPDVRGIVEKAFPLIPSQSANREAPPAKIEPEPRWNIALPLGPHWRDCHETIKAGVLWKSGEIQKRVDVAFGITRAQGRMLRMRAWIASGLRAPSIFDYLAPMALWLFALASMALTTVGHPEPICIHWL